MKYPSCPPSSVLSVLDKKRYNINRDRDHAIEGDGSPGKKVLRKPFFQAKYAPNLQESNLET